MSNLENNYRRVEDQIHSACSMAGRERGDVLLIAVSKNQSIAAIEDLYELGLRHFGESRVQELLTKKDQLPNDIHWHFIGHLQSNKARQIAPFIETVHSIDSQDTARELSKRAGEHQRTIGVLIEINISGEQQKNGVRPSDAVSLIETVAKECQNLIPVGLMGMASYEEDPEHTRPQFLLLRSLRDSITERHPELKAFKELSMGMTNDFEIAIECGATMVRIGSALFSVTHHS